VLLSYFIVVLFCVCAVFVIVFWFFLCGLLVCLFDVVFTAIWLLGFAVALVD